MYRTTSSLPEPLVLFVLRCLALLSLVASSGLAITPSAQEAAFANLFVGASGQQRAVTQYDPLLSQVARARAEDMARRGYFSHVDPDGYGPNYHVERAGYPLPDWWNSDRDTNYVESIAAGNGSASGTWSDFMGSSPHRQHLLGESDFHRASTSYGIGYAADPDSKYRHYWVVITAPPRPRPIISISTPEKNARVHTAEVTFSGAADDKVISVETRLENENGATAYQAAAGTRKWSVVISGLVPGANTLRVRGLDAKGKVLAEATRSIRYVAMETVTVAVAGPGKVTGGFLGTTERELGRRYTVQATPIADAVFVGWTGSASTTSPKLSFEMAEGLHFVATFVPDPFASSNGRYSGVLLNDFSSGGLSAGTASLKINRSGAFTGKIVIDGKGYAVRGKLGLDGTATITLRKTSRDPVAVQLALDLTGGSGLTVGVEGRGSGQFGKALTNTAKSDVQAGRYTVALSPDVSATDDQPQGYGTIAMNVSRFGRATLVGSLADGSTFSRASDVSEDGAVPVFASLYRKGGFIAGTLLLQSSDTADVEGTLHWAKPAVPLGKYFPAGFVSTLAANGSRYLPPSKGSPGVDVRSAEEATLSLSDGNLAEPLHQDVTLERDGRVSAREPLIQGLSVRISPVTGKFIGNFIHPVKGKTRIQGVILQKQNAGFGYFLGVDRSGYATVSAAP